MDWIDELLEEAQQHSEKDSLELHRTVILDEEGRLFFDKLAQEVKRGLDVFAASRKISEKDVQFEHRAGVSFSAKKLFPYPFVNVDARLGKRHILLRTNTRPDAMTMAQETSWTIDYCLGTGDQLLYVCTGGRQLGGVEDAAKLIVRKLFGL
jgi:hypothetical protein